MRCRLCHGPVADISGKNESYSLYKCQTPPCKWEGMSPEMDEPRIATSKVLVKEKATMAECKGKAGRYQCRKAATGNGYCDRHQAQSGAPTKAVKDKPPRQKRKTILHERNCHVGGYVVTPDGQIMCSTPEEAIALSKAITES